MHAPPPPPNLDPPGRAAEIRSAPSDVADRFRDPGVLAAEAELAHDIMDAADAVAQAHRQRDDLRIELEAATARLVNEASQPVLDERDVRGRSRTERQR